MMSCFLKKIDLTGYLASSDYDKFKCIKKIMVDDFLNIDPVKLINMMGVLDNFRIVLITEVYQDV